MGSASASLEYLTGMEDSSGLLVLNQKFLPVPQFALLQEAAVLRQEVEQYIQAKFSQAYGASLRHFLPLLLVLRCGENLSGVAGVTLAKNQSRLFLEHYLDGPVEGELARLVGISIARNRIAEIGNLVATTRGASRLVFVVLASALHRAGLDWMVFTATAPLQFSLRRLGFDLMPLQAASVSRLPGAGREEWGSYYEYAPEVVAGRLDSAMELIASRTMYRTLQRLFDAQIDGLATTLASELK